MARGVGGPEASRTLGRCVVTASVRVRAVLARVRARERFRFSSDGYVTRVAWQDGTGWVAHADVEDESAYHAFARDTRRFPPTRPLTPVRGVPTL